jgi:hypothetical protein
METDGLEAFKRVHEAALLTSHGSGWREPFFTEEPKDLISGRREDGRIWLGLPFIALDDYLRAPREVRWLVYVAAAVACRAVLSGLPGSCLSMGGPNTTLDLSKEEE